MTTPNETLHDATGYLSGTLDTAERAAFEAHLPACHDCQVAVASLAQVLGVLAHAVPQVTPRPELRERVLAALDDGAQSVQPRTRVVAPSLSTEARTPPVASPRILPWLSLAASLLLAVGVGAYAVRLQSRIAGLEDQLADAIARAVASESTLADARRVAGEAQSVMAVMAAPDVARINLAGQAEAPTARARALWSRNSGMVFTAVNLPPLPPDRVYQVWVITATAPLSAGLVMTDQNGNASVYFATPPDIPTPTAVAVTPEPAGGVPAPTGAIYLIGTPAPL